jgi:hypothetical protein
MALLSFETTYSIYGAVTQVPILVSDEVCSFLPKWYLITESSHGGR